MYVGPTKLRSLQLEKKVSIFQRALTLQQGQKKGVEMVATFSHYFFDLYASRNAEFTLPNAPQKFLRVSQSIMDTFPQTSLLDVLIIAIILHSVCRDVGYIWFKKMVIGLVLAILYFIRKSNLNFVGF